MVAPSSSRERDVAVHLAFQALAQVARGDVVAVAAGERRIVDREDHGDRGLVHDDGGKRHRVLDVGDGLADVDRLEAGDGHQIAGVGFGDLRALQPFEAVELGDLALDHGAVAAADGHDVARADAAVDHAAQRDAAHVVIVVVVGDQDLQRRVRISLRSGDELVDGLEERLQVLLGIGELEGAGALAGDGVEDGELDLVLAGVEVDVEVVDLVQDLFHARVLAIDLVDDHDRGEVQLQGLSQHESRLRQGPLRGVHEEEDAVHELQDALNLAAEVGVAGGVEDVDLDPAVDDGGVLGHDRDALFALQVVGVHDPLHDLLVLAEDAALPEHGVDEGGLAVVHVGHDGDVAQVIADGLSHGVL